MSKRRIETNKLPFKQSKLTKINDVYSFKNAFEDFNDNNSKSNTPIKINNESPDKKVTRQAASKKATEVKVPQPINKSKSSKQDANLINLIQTFSQKNVKKKETTIQSNLEIFKDFPIDYSIYQQLDLNITLKYESDEEDNQVEYNKEDLESYAKVIKEGFDTFFKKNPFSYYEYSNPRNRKDSTHSSIDNLNYDFLIEKNNKDFNSIENSNRIAGLIKDINYLSSFSSVYKRFIRGETLNLDLENDIKQEHDNFFYVITPLYCYYFFKYEKEIFNETINNIDDSGALISSTSRIMDKNLHENRIEYEQIDFRRNPILQNKNKNEKQIDLFSIQHNTTESEVMSNFINNLDALNTHNRDCIIYVKNYYYTQLFNFIINEYEDSSVSIFAPYSFDNSNIRNCKISFDTIINKDSGTISFNIKIYGCLFYINTIKLYRFLTGEKCSDFTIFSILKDEKIPNFEFDFNMKFYPLMKTSNFYTINRKLFGPLDKIFMQDKSSLSVKVHNI